MLVPYCFSKEIMRARERAGLGYLGKKEYFRGKTEGCAYGMLVPCCFSQEIMRARERAGLGFLGINNISGEKLRVALMACSYLIVFPRK